MPRTIRPPRSASSPTVRPPHPGPTSLRGCWLRVVAPPARLTPWAAVRHPLPRVAGRLARWPTAPHGQCLIRVLRLEGIAVSRLLVSRFGWGPGQMGLFDTSEGREAQRILSSAYADTRAREEYNDLRIRYDRAYQHLRTKLTPEVCGQSPAAWRTRVNCLEVPEPRPILQQSCRSLHRHRVRATRC
jgi:hypothetical protein